MKFFKYLIFVALSLFSINSFAAAYIARNSQGVTATSATALGACKALNSSVQTASNGNCYQTTVGSLILGTYKLDESACAVDQSSDFSTITKNPFTGTMPSTVCYQKCSFSTSWGSSPINSNQLQWYGIGKGTGASCTTDTNLTFDTGTGTDGGSGTDGNCTTTGSTTNCTGGQGGQGGSSTTGSGGQGGQGGNASITVDMQSVVNAVNSASSSISQKLDQVSSSITSSISGMTNRITDAIGLTNTKLSEIKVEQENTISAVYSNRDAVNASRQAIVSAVNNLESTISAVTNAVNNNTTAINSNGDKVSNAVKDNVTATNAVKTAVENLNLSVNAVLNAVKENADRLNNTVNENGDKVVVAVNQNGDKVVDAVNVNGNQITDSVDKGTEATLDNGKKLDGIKDGVEEGNGLLKEIKGLLKDIKDWLTGDPPEDTKPEIPKKELDEKMFDTGRISVSGSDCPSDKNINWSTPYGTVSYTISYQDLCQSSGWIGYLVLASAYLLGAQIVMRDS